MASSVQTGWKAYKLHDLGFVGRGKSKHRPRNDKVLYGGKYPFFQTGDVKAAGYKLRHYSQTYNEVGLAQSKLWHPGTLCITIAANIADTAILDIAGCFPDSIVGFVPDENKADVRFVKYSIDTLKLQMRNISRGTTQDNLSVDKLLLFDILAPDTSMQRKIASVLGAYDDLIENNSKRIEKLEAIARLLYKKDSAAIKKQTTLGSKVSVKKGKNITKATIKPGDVPVVAGGLQPAYFHDTPNTIAPIITVSASGANAGYTNLYYQNVWASDCSYIDTASTPYVYFFYVVLQDNQYAITHMQKGSAQPHVYPADLERLEIPDFSDSQIQSINQKLTPIYDLVGKLKAKNNKLTRTRDLLLPRLMSGEIEI